MKDNFILKGKDAERHLDMLDGLESFHNQFNYDNNDRAIAVVGIAFIEDLLLYCLENYFPSNSSTVTNMLSHKGCLGTFKAKVDLLYSLGFIDKIVKQDLDNLAQIRNEFAHKTTVSFDARHISRLCLELKWHKTAMMMETPEVASVRDVFKIGVNTIVSHLHGIASICRGEKRNLKKSWN